MKYKMTRGFLSCRKLSEVIIVGLTAAMVVCGSAAQAEPSISNIYPDGNGKVFQNVDTFSFTASCPSSDTILPSGLTANVSATNLFGSGSLLTLSVGSGLTVTDTSVGAMTAWLATFPLTSNTIYSVAINVSDANGVISTKTILFDTIDPNLYTFEAEDYNYTDVDTGNAGLFFDNPQTDAYSYKLATEGIDDHVASPAGGNDYGRSSYPPESSPACWSTEGVSGSGRAAYDGTGFDNYGLNYTGNGNWANYTRTLPAGTFNVYMRVSSPDGASSGSARMDQVLSDPTQPNQQTAPIGTFPIPATGDWNNYQWTPLLAPSGKLARVSGGLETLRLVTVNGGYNIDFFMLVPAPDVAPYVTGFTPDLSFAQFTNECSFTVHSSVGIVSSNVKLNIDGRDIADLTFGGTPNLLSVRTLVTWSGYHTAIVTMTDSIGTDTNTFQFYTFDPEESYLFEAEDYNYTDINTGDAGLFFENPQTNAYSYKLATEGIDDHVASPAGGNDYGRSSYPPESSPACWSIQGVDGSWRAAYDGTGFDNFGLNYTGNGNWANYTRTLPAGTFNVYMRVSSPDGASSGSARMDQVLSDPTQPNQQTAPIGTFPIPATGDWNNYQWTPLLAPSGKLARVSGGLETLRLFTLRGGYNVDLFILTPAQTDVPPEAPYVTGFTPDLTFSQFTTECTFGVHSSAGIANSNVKLNIDGRNISDLTFSGTPNLLSVRALVTWSGYHTAIITMTDSVGTSTNTFQFYTFDPEESYLFEAEDYNYSDANGVAGKFFENPQTNAYRNTLATEGIDDHVASPAGGNDYGRSSYPPESSPACWSIQGVDGSWRAAYDGTGFDNYGLNYTGDGNWANYTRTLPAGTFNVYMRVSSPDGASSGSARMDQVLSDPTQPNQQTAPIGTFPIPATGDWNNYQWTPLLDQSGELARVSGGLGTLRLVTVNGGYNIDFFMLTPASAAPAAPRLTVSLAGENFSVSFQTQTGFSYQVFYKNNLTDTTWTALGSSLPGNGAVQSISVVNSSASRFFCVRVQ